MDQHGRLNAKHDKWQTWRMLAFQILRQTQYPSQSANWFFFAQHNLKNAISYISNNQAKQQPIHNWFDSSLEKC